MGNTDGNKEIGAFIRARREALGLSMADAARESGLHHSYWSYLEMGRYQTPAPNHLRIIAETLQLPLEDLYSLAGYDIPKRLPSFKPYMRAKYDLPPEAVADLERYFEMLRNYYGVPKDKPVFPPKKPSLSTAPKKEAA
jgi:transcriptional regulator with XRE-family HTH domain